MKQIFIAAKNSPVAFKLVAHNTDGDQLVIKSRHADVGMKAALAAGLAPEQIRTEKGSKYHLTFVPRGPFLANLAAVVLGVLEGALDVSTSQLVPIYGDLGAAVGEANDGPDEDEEDGDDDDGEDEDGDEDE